MPPRCTGRLWTATAETHAGEAVAAVWVPGGRANNDPNGHHEHNGAAHGVNHARSIRRCGDAGRRVAGVAVACPRSFGFSWSGKCKNHHWDGWGSKGPAHPTSQQLRPTCTCTTDLASTTQGGGHGGRPRRQGRPSQGHESVGGRPRQTSSHEKKSLCIRGQPGWWVWPGSTSPTTCSSAACMPLSPVLWWLQAVMIVGRDGPVYECDIGALKVGCVGGLSLHRSPAPPQQRKVWAPAPCLLVCRALQRDDVSRSAQFIIHAALDMVDVRQWTSPVTYVCGLCGGQT
jgi:hypothetical protein